MTNKRVLTIQDISCVGQCSMTVALPIISACGIETSVLPSAVLSTHTAGFSGFTFRDLTEDMPPIREHWVKENIVFDAVYTGYLGTPKHVDYVLEIFRDTAPQGVKIVDPAMGDNGMLYPGFDEVYAAAMTRLCANADYILPNITEACFMTGLDYKETYDRAYVNELLEALKKVGCRNIILTGISYAPGKTGVVVYENGVYNYYEHEKLPNSCHGTGDIYASAFVGAFMRGKSAYDAARIAADYTVECIKGTEKEHWYGARFEPALGKLIQAL